MVEPYYSTVKMQIRVKFMESWLLLEEADWQKRVTYSHWQFGTWPTRCPVTGGKRPQWRVSWFSFQSGCHSFPFPSSSIMGKLWFQCWWSENGEAAKPSSFSCVTKTRIIFDARHAMHTQALSVVSRFLVPTRRTQTLDRHSSGAQIYTLTFDSSLLAAGYLKAMSNFLYFTTLILWIVFRVINPESSPPNCSKSNDS